jgi:hypothetical protein
MFFFAVLGQNAHRYCQSVLVQFTIPEVLVGYAAVTVSIKVKVKVKVTLRLAVYRQSICLGIKPLENHDQNFFFFLPPTEPFRY